MNFDLKLVHVEETYIEFLKRYQEHILPNKKDHSAHKRLYLYLTTEEGKFLLIPLASPKESDLINGKIRPNFLTIIRIIHKGEFLGTLRLSHMITAPTNAISYFDINKCKDMQYKSLVTKEYLAIKKMQDKIRKQVKRLYLQKETEDEHYLYTNQELPKYLENTLDFHFIEKMSLEYQPGLEASSNPKLDKPLPEVLENMDEEENMDYVMLDKVIETPMEKYRKVDNEPFDIEEEMMSLRRMVSEEEPVIPEEESPILEEVPVEEKKPLPVLPSQGKKAVFQAAPQEESKGIEVQSTKAILLAIKSILSGHSDTSILLNNYFAKNGINYQILEFDSNKQYALLKNCKSNDIMLVSNFPKDENLGWEKPINFGSESDSYSRGKRTYLGFIK